MWIYKNPLFLTDESKVALQGALAGFDSFRKAARALKARGVDLSAPTLGKLARGRTPVDRREKHDDVQRLFDCLDIPLVLKKTSSSLSEYVFPKWGNSDVWSTRSQQWELDLLAAHDCHELLQQHSPGLHGLGTSDAADRERFAFAALADAVQSAQYRGACFKPKQLDFVYDVGLHAMSRLHIDGHPGAALWLSRLVHNRRDFSHNIYSASVMDLKKLGISMGEQLLTIMRKAKEIAWEPHRNGSSAPENHHCAGMNAGCEARIHGHMGEMKTMRHHCDAASDIYPNEIRLLYWRGLFEYRNGNRFTAEKYLRRAAYLPLDCKTPHCSCSDLQRVARALMALAFSEPYPKFDMHALLRERAFFIKARCSIPEFMTKFFDEPRDAMKLPRIKTLRLGRGLTDE